MKIYIDLGSEGYSKFEFKEKGFKRINIDPLTKNGINKAAWIYDGEIEFSELPNLASSTIIREKRDWVTGKVIKVKCFDFSRWIKKFMNDYVVLKMNIEGAEIKILEKMIKDDTLKIIKKLFIEWHSGKIITNDYDSKKEIIKDNLKRLKIEWEDIRRL